ncbi:hypothetical protein PR048_000500 [Dryococelus australis]|uniref:Uncharacterized protein n=1 Tax=Dryococelus australis TaxID=614101 RepID=A0ABQ9IES0_9NEOP|nr:hypothetical protein PR048_000500 [Dryococelus australis]
MTTPAPEMEANNSAGGRGEGWLKGCVKGGGEAAGWQGVTRSVIEGDIEKGRLGVSSMFDAFLPRPFVRGSRGNEKKILGSVRENNLHSPFQIYDIYCAWLNYRLKMRQIDLAGCSQPIILWSESHSGDRGFDAVRMHCCGLCSPTGFASKLKVNNGAGLQNDTKIQPTNFGYRCHVHVAKKLGPTSIQILETSLKATYQDAFFFLPRADVPMSKQKKNCLHKLALLHCLGAGRDGESLCATSQVFSVRENCVVFINNWFGTDSTSLRRALDREDLPGNTAHAPGVVEGASSVHNTMSGKCGIIMRCCKNHLEKSSRRRKPSLLPYVLIPVLVRCMPPRNQVDGNHLGTIVVILYSQVRCQLAVNWVRFPAGIAPGFSHVRIVQDDAVGRWVFSGMSRFAHPCIPALLHTHFASPSSALKTSIDEWHSKLKQNLESWYSRRGSTDRQHYIVPNTLPPKGEVRWIFDAVTYRL